MPSYHENVDLEAIRKHTIPYCSTYRAFCIYLILYGRPFSTSCGVVPLRPPVAGTAHQLDCSSLAFASMLLLYQIVSAPDQAARPLQQSKRSGDQPAKMFRRVRCDRSRTCCQRSTSGPLRKSDLTDTRSGPSTMQLSGSRNLRVRRLAISLQKHAADCSRSIANLLQASRIRYRWANHLQFWTWSMCKNTTPARDGTNFFFSIKKIKK